MTPAPAPNQSQSFGNISSINGSSNPFNITQASGDATIAQSQTTTKTTNSDLQAVLDAVEQLKKAIAAAKDVDDMEKEMVALPIQKLETELQKSQPDQTVVDRMITTLKKTLDGVITLAGPINTVATLPAKT